MYVQALKHFPHIPLVVLAMLLFVGSFVAIVVMTYKLGTQQEAADLPLQDEEPAHG